MSIIYNALKKTQLQREPQQKSRIKFYFLPIIFVLMLVFGFSSYYLYHSLHLSFPHFFASKTQKTILPIVPMKLNGVYISETHKIAMINQELYSLGASINNMKITEIDDNHILLEDDKKHQKTLSLSTG